LSDRKSPPIGGLFVVRLVENEQVEQNDDADGNAAEPEDDTFHMRAFLLFR
jgi:hypothetical protein